MHCWPSTLAGQGQSQADFVKSKLMSKNAKSRRPWRTSVSISSNQLWIVYHAPSVRGRKIFGGADALQPDDTIWRLGADWATVLHTDAPAWRSGNSRFPRGDYSLYIALDKGQWRLIINKQSRQWGHPEESGATTDDPARDVGRVALYHEQAGGAQVEQLKNLAFESRRQPGQAGHRLGECRGFHAVYREVAGPRLLELIGEEVRQGNGDGRPLRAEFAVADLANQLGSIDPRLAR